MHQVFDAVGCYTFYLFFCLFFVSFTCLLFSSLFSPTALDYSAYLLGQRLSRDGFAWILDTLPTYA